RKNPAACFCLRFALPNDSVGCLAAQAARPARQGLLLEKTRGDEPRKENTMRRQSRTTLALFILICILAAAATPKPIWGAHQEPDQKLKFRKVEKAVKGRYIVVFNDESVETSDLPTAPDDATAEQREAVTKQRRETIEQRIDSMVEELARAHKGT